MFGFENHSIEFQMRIEQLAPPSLGRWKCDDNNSPDWIGTTQEFQLEPQADGEVLLKFCHGGWKSGGDGLRRTRCEKSLLHLIPSERGRNHFLSRDYASCRWGAWSSRPLLSASRRRSGSSCFRAPFGEWNLPPHLFGETPNRATETVALPFPDCIVPAWRRCVSVSAAEAGCSSGSDHR